MTLLVTIPMTVTMGMAVPTAAPIAKLVAIPMVATTVAVPMTSGGQDHPVDRPHAAHDRGHPYDRDR